MGYRINNFNLFGGGGTNRSVKSSGKGNNSRNNNSQTSRNNARGRANHDLNIRLDLSYRKQASILRDIATVSSTASSGNTAFKFSLMADYTLSKLLTMSFYLDRQTNTPLLSSNSYPTTTQDFGLSVPSLTGRKSNNRSPSLALPKREGKSPLNLPCRRGGRKVITIEKEKKRLLFNTARSA